MKFCLKCPIKVKCKPNRLFCEIDGLCLHGLFGGGFRQDLKNDTENKKVFS